MKIKIKTNVVDQRIKEKYSTHGNLYRALGTDDLGAFHIGECDFSIAKCSGFSLWVNSHPEHIPQIMEDVEMTVYFTKDLLPPLLVSAQYMFYKIALQAQKSVRTNIAEDLLLRIKNAIENTSKYPYCFLGKKEEVKKIEWGLTEASPLSLLQTVEGSAYLYSEKGILNFTKVEIGEKLFYFFNFAKEKEILLPIIRWTGKELVAVHTENIPESLVDKGIIQIEHKK